MILKKHRVIDWTATHHVEIAFGQVEVLSMLIIVSDHSLASTRHQNHALILLSDHY